MRMTTAQWVVLMLGLWLTFVVAHLLLDGLPSVVVQTCVLAGFAVSAIERWQNWRRTRVGGGER